jgi:hypothetical protein
MFYVCSHCSRQKEPPLTLRDISQSDWAHLSELVVRRRCKELARRLPPGFELSSVKDHSYCGETHRVARFSRREDGNLVHFVLVPGGEVSLGFDGRNFQPSRWQIESYRRWPEELLRQDVDPRYVHWSISEFVDAETSLPRTICVPAIMIEVEARHIEPRSDIELLREGDPMFERFRDRYPESGKREAYGGELGEYSYIVERDRDGTLRVWRRPPTTVRYVEERLAQTGMRLPTGDEWEYVCGAAAPTLFRWGDDNPPDFCPIDTPAERVRERARALSRGLLHPETAALGWDLHERLNLFGLRIAHDPYRMELVSDEPWTLGGDGGCYICGGAGTFLTWFPLATAFRGTRWDRFSPDQTNVANEYYRLRRVIPID